MAANSKKLNVNGHYVVRSPQWNNGGTSDAGAVTWRNGTTWSQGTISANNSLVGSLTDDAVGSGGVWALTNGNYVVESPDWDSSSTGDAGAVTLAWGAVGATGLLNSSNSVIGLVVGGGANMNWDYDYANAQLVVGRPDENIVTLFRLPVVFLPLVLRNW